MHPAAMPAPGIRYYPVEHFTEIRSLNSTSDAALLALITIYRTFIKAAYFGSMYKPFASVYRVGSFSWWIVPKDSNVHSTHAFRPSNLIVFAYRQTSNVIPYLD